jgi:putative N6-adenine-specific DNA methylase
MRFIAKTLYGLEKVLAEELKGFDAEEITIANRAVLFNGDLQMMYRVNYLSRTALSVLMQINDFRIGSAEDLYKKGLLIEWDRYMDVDNTFSVAPVVQSPLFNHTGFAGLKFKDSIADYFRKKAGRRPSVNTSDPDLLINLHISNDRVSVSLDSSVVPLFKRGYRQEQAIAPLNEVLTAGMLLISKWNAKSDLIDPMCGSGTIPIEAGLIAGNIPPGKFRQFFGFMKWKGFNIDLFNKVKEASEEKIITSPVRISGFDISEQAVSHARANIERAGLTEKINIEVSDFKDLRPVSNEGVIFINPPYGERLLPEETDSLYSTIGSSLKHNFQGFTAWIISSNKDSLKKIGLKPKEKYTLFNGALECSFLKYELYQGSRKAEKA